MHTSMERLAPRTNFQEMFTEMFTAISVEVFPGVLQTEKKLIGKWREAIEREMNIR